MTDLRKKRNTSEGAQEGEKSSDQQKNSLSNGPHRSLGRTDISKHGKKTEQRTRKK